MTKRLVMVLLLVACIAGIVTLVACSNVKIEGISIDESSKFVTEYQTNDDLNLDGLKILVKRTDGIESSIFVADHLQDIKIINFSSRKPKENLKVIVEYKGHQTSFLVNVRDDTSATLKHKVSFFVGEGATPIPEQDVSNFGTVQTPESPSKLDENERKVFDGWYKEEKCINKWNFANDKVIADTQIYAKWADLFTVEFKVVPPEGSSIEQDTFVRYVKRGDSVSNVPEVPDVVGYDKKWERSTFENVQRNITTQSVYTIKLFTIQFIYMDERNIAQEVGKIEKVPYGTDMTTDPLYISKIEEMTPPDSVGFTRFTGEWIGDINSISTNMSVQARYTSKEYDVVFNLNYRDASHPDFPNTPDNIHETYENIIHGNVIDEPAKPMRENYRFLGWFKDQGHTVRYDFEFETLKESLTLYAKWEREYQVHFLITQEFAASFSELEDITFTENGVQVTYKIHSKFSVAENGKIVLPPAPLLTGYTGKWEVMPGALDEINSDLKITASFEINSYKVEFCDEQGTVLETQNVNYQGSATEPTIIPNKSGYDFDGWREDFTNIVADIKVYPKYLAKNVTIGVHPRSDYLSPNGDNFYEIVGKFDSIITLENPRPTYTGHEFEGWYSDSELSQKWILNENVIKTEGRVDLYAKWLNLYNIRFETETGDPISNGSYVLVQGSILTSIPEVPYRLGHNGDWYIYENATHTDTKANLAYWAANPIQRNYQLRPKYVKRMFDISFVIDAQIETIPIQVEWEGTLTSIVDEVTINATDALHRIGRNFIGWEPAQNLDIPVRENMTFNARSELKRYEVIWRDANNQVLHTDAGVPHGANAEAIFNNSGVQRPLKEGYIFTGWRVTLPVGGSMDPVTSNITLEPVYQISSYTVSITNLFDGDEKLENQSQNCNYVDYLQFGESATAIKNPSRTGHTFIGWESSRFMIERRQIEGIYYWVLTNTAYSGSGTFRFTNQNLIIFKDLVYRTNLPNKSGLGQEEWSQMNYLVSPSQNHGWIDSGSANPELNVKSIAFTGDFFYVFGENSDFTAKYAINYYTITFNVSTTATVQNAPSLFTAQHNTTPIIPSPKPTRPGYVFLGWYEEPEFINRWDTASGKAYQPLTSNYTVYARWEATTPNATPGITYTLNQEQTGYIVSNMAGVSSAITNVVIPNYYNGKPVVGIGNSAVYSNPTLASQMTAISLPNTLSQIAPDAFKYCVALEQIEIPAYVKILSSNAFEGCISLKTVTFKTGSELESIEAYAFVGNSSLENVNFPSTLKNIGERAFYGCSAMITLDIPIGVMTIGDGAFADCTKLMYAKFSFDEPINLGVDVFHRDDNSYNFLKLYVQRPNLYSPTVSSANENWHKYYQENKIFSINEISIDGEWSYRLDSTIGVQLVQYMGNNTIVTVPMNLQIPNTAEALRVTRLLNYAFDTRVQEVLMSSSVEFEKDAFTTATSLTNITVRITNNSIPAINFDLGYVYRNAGINLSKFTVSSSKTLFELFGGNPPTNLKEVVILEQEDYIVASMFMNCSNIEIVRFDTSITEIRDNAFNNCASLKQVYISNNTNSVYNILNKIGAGAFKDCYSLQTFYKTDPENPDFMIEGIPSTITQIGHEAFTGSRWLMERPKGLVIIGDGIVYTYKQSDELSTVVMIPTNVKNVMDRAFYGNTKITHIIPTDVTNSQWQYIGERAFSNCTALEAVVLPAGLIRIGNYAFEDSAKLGTLVFFGSNSVPLLGADFINRTLRRMDGINNVPGIEIFADNALSEENKATFNALNISLGISVTYVAGLAINYSEEQTNKWVCSDASVAGIKAIKYYGDASEYAVPESINGVVTEIANNAFTRNTTKLGLYVTATVLPHTFTGITRLTEITLRAPNIGSVRMDGDVLHRLMQVNTSLTILNTVAVYSVRNILNSRQLPASIKTVNIVEGQVTIEASFLENCHHIENINILSRSGNSTFTTPLEEELTQAVITERNIELTIVKERAFNGTAWMDTLEKDFVVILDGMLVGYKGADSVLNLPNTIKAIGYGVFKDNTQIEIVYIPSSVVKIESYAFNNASNLIKTFLSHETNIPSVSQDSFTLDSGREVFVKGAVHSSYVADSNWSTFSVKVEPNVPFISKELSRAFRKDSTGNLLLDVRSQNYLLDTQGSGSDNCIIHWYRDVIVSYDIPDNTPSYQKDTLDLSLYSVVFVRENTESQIPDSITNAGVTYTIKAIGNNAFMSSVDSIVINLDDSVSTYSFSNLRRTTSLTILKTESLANRQITGKQLTAIINDVNINRINYLGSVTLDQLLEIVLTGTPSQLNFRPAGITAVGILDGAVEIVDIMLRDWAQVEQIIVPRSVNKIGVNAFETTAWFTNYNSPLYGKDMLIVADKILYKYRGTSTAVVIPAPVEIINTGAFSRATGDPGAWTWTSELGVTSIRFAVGSRAEQILAYAFKECSYLGDFNTPDSLRTIDPTAFEGTNFNVDLTSGLLILEGSVAQGRTIVKYFGDPSVVFLNIPADIRTIAARAFQGLTSLQNVNWGGEVTQMSFIGESAFEGCSALVDVPLFSGSSNTPFISYVGRNAFKDTPFGNSAKYFLRSDGKRVVYKQTSSFEYIIRENIYSITPGALISNPTSIILEPSASISTSDLRAVLSMPSVRNFTSHGSKSLKDLIGSDEKLNNIKNLFFTPGISAIVSEYAKDWYSVEEIAWPGTLVSLGRDVATGTKWLENIQSDYVTTGGASLAGILIKYKGVNPEVFIDHRITSITPDAFRGNADITKVEFSAQSTIREIAASSFAGCTSLVEIKNMPMTVTNIGQDAFKDTPWLNSKEGLVVINNLLIANQGEETEIIIPENVTTIYPYVFAGNISITSLTIDKYSRLKRIEAGTFANCVNLTQVQLSESIDFVDRQAFTNTLWLSNIQQSGGFIFYQDSYAKVYKIITYVGSRDVVTIPAETSEIGASTFINNKVIVRVNINKALHLPDYLFKDCSNLSQIVLSPGVTIGAHTFDGTPWITTKVQEFVIEGDGNLIKYNGSSTSIVLSHVVKHISADVFANNTTITSIDLSQTNITKIPENAFSGATALSTIIFNQKLKEIGKNAFLNTPWLASQSDYVVIQGILIAYKGSSAAITIPSTVTYIPEYVFKGNESITELSFDANSLAVADYAFYGCTSLATITNIALISSLGANTFKNTAYYSALTDNALVIVNSTLLGVKGNLTNIVVPSSVSKIVDGAFQDSKITSLSFEDRTTRITIGKNAFNSSKLLSEVTLIDMIDEVGYRAFYNTAWLSSQTSPYIVVNNKLLLYNGTGIAIDIAASITRLARGVFINNKSITTLRFNTSVQSEIMIPEMSFSGCTSLYNVTLPRFVYIGEKAFEGTPWLAGKGIFAAQNNKLFAYQGNSTSIVLPSNITSIYPYVFSKNTSITTIDLSQSQVTTLIDKEFSGCTALSTVILNTSLQDLDIKSFEGSPWLINYSANNGNTKFIQVSIPTANIVKLLGYISTDTTVVIPSDVNYLGQSAFKGNNLITSVSFKNIEFKLSILSNSFKDCTSLSTVIFNNFVESIGINAFENTPWYNNLPANQAFIVANKSILLFKGTAIEYTVPETITHIGSNAFYGSGITTLHMQSSIPCSLGAGNVLEGITTIYVPDATALNAYSLSPFWNQYSSRLKVAENP